MVPQFQLFNVSIKLFTVCLVNAPLLCVVSEAPDNSNE